MKTVNIAKLILVALGLLGVIFAIVFDFEVKGIRIIGLFVGLGVALAILAMAAGEGARIKRLI